MPTKPLDRLMFAQGNLCFFGKEPLARADASVEHLVASANGGTNADDNCVACCKTVTQADLASILKQLQDTGRVLIENGKISYAL